MKNFHRYIDEAIALTLQYHKELNPKLTKGDRVMCLHMDGETSVPMGTTGTVSRTTKDPFEVDSEIITVANSRLA